MGRLAIRLSALTLQAYGIPWPCPKQDDLQDICNCLKIKHIFRRVWVKTFPLGKQGENNLGHRKLLWGRTEEEPLAEAQKHPYISCWGPTVYISPLCKVAQSKIFLLPTHERLSDMHWRDIWYVLFAQANTEQAAFSSKLCRDMLRKQPPRICQTLIRMLIKYILAARRDSLSL